MGYLVESPVSAADEFGFSLSAEADVVSSRMTAQADFTISLTWRAEPEG